MNTNSNSNRRTVKSIRHEKDKRRRPLAEKEWNWTKLPPAERAICADYEYLRESQIIRKLVEQLRKCPDLEKKIQQLVIRIKRHKPGSFRHAAPTRMSREQIRLNNVFCDLFMFFPQFPETPWLSLPRQRRMDFLRLKAKPVLICEEGDDIRAWDKARDLQVRAYGVNCWIPPAVVNPGSGVKEAQTEYAQQVSKRFKQFPKSIIGKTGGKDGPLTSLRQLGALRLLKYFKQHDAAVFTKQFLAECGCTFPLYSEVDHGPWSRAKK